jgi:hypothetical protein
MVSDCPAISNDEGNGWEGQFHSNHAYCGYGIKHRSSSVVNMNIEPIRQVGFRKLSWRNELLGFRLRVPQRVGDRAFISAANDIWSLDSEAFLLAIDLQM